jgi:hypothetical protein
MGMRAPPSTGLPQSGRAERGGSRRGGDRVRVGQVKVDLQGLRDLGEITQFDVDQSAVGFVLGAKGASQTRKSGP